MTAKNTLSSSDDLKLRTHAPYTQDFQEVYQYTVARITQEGDKPWATLQERLFVLDQLSEFKLGQFLLLNNGLDAYWIDYIIQVSKHPPLLQMNNIENFILNKLPICLATRERFGIFQQTIQNVLFDGIVMASIPCGLMSNFLTLDYSQIKSPRLIGIDLDYNALTLANEQAIKQKLDHVVEYRQHDAWDLQMDKECHLITSNGLNFYESDKNAVVDLYKNFFNALKPGGLLITSFLTPPPSVSENSPWNMDLIPEDDIKMSILILKDLVNVRWNNNYRTFDEMADDLEKAGFNNINFLCDSRKMMPTVVAQRL